MQTATALQITLTVDVPAHIVEIYAMRDSWLDKKYDYVTEKSTLDDQIKIGRRIGISDAKYTAMKKRQKELCDLIKEAGYYVGKFSDDLRRYRLELSDQLPKDVLRCIEDMRRSRQS